MPQSETEASRIPYLCELLGLWDLSVGFLGVVPLGLERRFRHGERLLLKWCVVRGMLYIFDLWVGVAVRDEVQAREGCSRRCWFRRWFGAFHFH